MGVPWGSRDRKQKTKFIIRVRSFADAYGGNTTAINCLFILILNRLLIYYQMTS